MAQRNIFKITIFLTFAFMLAFSACSQKKYFKPKEPTKTTRFKSKISSPIALVNRDSAELKNRSVLEKNNEEKFVLHKKWKFLNSAVLDSQKFYIAQNDCKEIMIVSDEQSFKIDFDKCAVSATYAQIGADKFLALQTQENSIFVFKNNAEIFSQTLSSVNAISKLNAAPIFTQAKEPKIVFPSLDGRILIYDIKTQRITRDILIASEKFFNNIIYLEVKNDIVLAATNKRISIILDNAKTFNFDGDFRDVKMHENNVYVLNNDGKILELDSTLKVLRESKFEYARLFGIVIVKNHLYTLERNQYLIDLDLQYFTHKIYRVNLPKRKKMFYTDDTIYYHNKKKSF